ncbi:MAG: DUF2934 domain-containing protein [Blastocatellia bacterium]
MSRESTEELRRRLLGDERVREMISRRAYEIYVMRGGKPGGEGHDWFQAESEILSVLIEEESRRAADPAGPGGEQASGDVDEAGVASPVGEAIGMPETSDRLEQRPGLTAEERAESQSAVAAWSPAEPPSAGRAPIIGDQAELQVAATEPKKNRSRAPAISTGPREGKPSAEKSAAAKEPTAKKTASVRIASKKSAGPQPKTTKSRKKTS